MLGERQRVERGRDPCAQAGYRQNKQPGHLQRDCVSLSAGPDPIHLPDYVDLGLINTQLSVCFSSFSVMEITDHSVLDCCLGDGNSSYSLCHCGPALPTIPCGVFTGMDIYPCTSIHSSILFAFLAPYLLPHLSPQLYTPPLNPPDFLLHLPPRATMANLPPCPEAEVTFSHHPRAVLHY